MQAYKQLEKIFYRSYQISHLQALAHWDNATMMPPESGEARAKALAESTLIQLELLEAPHVAELFAQAKNESLNEWQSANLREMNREWKNSTSVDKDLVEKKILAGSQCEMAWRQFRKENNWKDFLPLLNEVVLLTREEAKQRSSSSGLSLYDSLLDLYEPGQKSENIDLIFSELKQVLPSLTQQIIDKQAAEAFTPPKGSYPLGQQKKLAEELMKVLGFDFSKGRLDVSTHPFCGGVSEDVRITSRYEENDFTSGIMGVIHETGHASYEQGLPQMWLSQPVGHARGMGLHESQSLLFEMQVSRSPEFLSFLLPLLQKYFPDVFSKSSGDTKETLLKLYNQVQPSFIRVDADEVTYPSHVILRYEIEKDLIESNIETKDIPELWDEKMKSYLGITTKDNYTDGCMQDIHWTDGSFGYFPTYTLGAMNAAQIYRKACIDCPEITASITDGQFEPLRGWLKENIWSKGSFFEIDQLMLSATGETLQAQYFVDHLKNRYL